MTIATFNVNSLRKRLGIVLDWLEQRRPDVLCLQETKVRDEDFPALAITAAGYHASFRGMKGYNGVAVLTRTPPDTVHYGFDDGRDPDDVRLLRVVVNKVTIVNTYVPQGFRLDSPKYAYKLEWFKRLRAYFDKHLSRGKPVLWCGDVNVAPEAIDVHSPNTHLKHVCFHEDVRRAYKDTVAWGFEDVFRRLHPDRKQYTFWDYRQPSSLDADKGWRIDHLLATAPLAETCVRCEVDTEPRRAQDPSDHTFLWADFQIGS